MRIWLKSLEAINQRLGKKIYWIEAQPILAKRLREISNFPSVVFEAAIWDEGPSEMEMFIANNSESSSLLPMFKHLEIYPDIRT